MAIVGTKTLSGQQIVTLIFKNLPPAADRDWDLIGERVTARARSFASARV